MFELTNMDFSLNIIVRKNTLYQLRAFEAKKDVNIWNFIFRNIENIWARV